MTARKARSARNRQAHAVERATVLGKSAPIDPLDEEPMGSRAPLANIPWNKVALTRTGENAVARALLAGYPRNEIAAALGMTVATLRRIITSTPKLADAVEVRKDVEEAELRDLLLGMARKGDTVAAIFLAKAQYGWRDRQDGKYETETRPAGVLVVPATVPLEDWCSAAARQQAQFRSKTYSEPNG